MFDNRRNTESQAVQVNNPFETNDTMPSNHDHLMNSKLHQQSMDRREQSLEGQRGSNTNSMSNLGLI